MGTNGRESLPTIWLRSRIKASKKPGLFIAQLNDIPDVIEAPIFYMDASTVRVPEEVKAGETYEGHIAAILFDEVDETLVVQVMGEPVSYGPNLSVPKALSS